MLEALKKTVKELISPPIEEKSRRIKKLNNDSSVLTL